MKSSVLVKARRFILSVLALQLVVDGLILAREADPVAPASARETSVKRHTWKELRDRHVVKQKLDYSCGAAAMATLMMNYFGENTSEQEMLDLLRVRIKSLSKEEALRKKRVGFSLLDLKYVAQQKGYKAAGFKLTFDQLRQLSAPVIVYVEPFGYHHFAVLRGIAGDRVFLADPSRGNLRMSIAQFKDEYGGVVFALGKAGEENILSYPLALSRPDDYVRPDLRRVIYGANNHRDDTGNITLRSAIR